MLLALAYRFPSKYLYGQAFNITHALSFKAGGFVTIRQNKVRDSEAQLLKEICNDVKIKSALQPIEWEFVEEFIGHNAKPDVGAREFLRDGQNAYFVVIH